MPIIKFCQFLSLKISLKTDFNKIPPVTLEKTDKGYLVNDGMHRVFLAKKMNRPLTAYVWVNKPNDSPFVKEIEKLFNKK